jgi:hypothetical protein
VRGTTPDPRTARKGLWLNTVVLGFTGMLLLMFLAGFFFPKTAAGLGRPVSATLILALAGLYLLNRRGHVTMAAISTIVLYSVGNLGIMYLLPVPLPNIATWPSRLT